MVAKGLVPLLALASTCLPWELPLRPISSVLSPMVGISHSKNCRYRQWGAMSPSFVAINECHMIYFSWDKEGDGSAPKGSDRNGPVWSGLEVKPDQTSCLHNNRSDLTGQTNKTAKNKTEIKGKKIYIILLIIDLIVITLAIVQLRPSIPSPKTLTRLYNIYLQSAAAMMMIIIFQI